MLVSASNNPTNYEACLPNPAITQMDINNTTNTVYFPGGVLTTCDIPAGTVLTFTDPASPIVLKPGGAGYVRLMGGLARDYDVNWLATGFTLHHPQWHSAGILDQYRYGRDRNNQAAC